MGAIHALAASSLGALCLLAGCGGGGGSAAQGTETTVATAPPTTWGSAPALRAALLTAADVPGSTQSAPERAGDVSACFPGNPLGARENPYQVVGPDLAISQGNVQRTYSSSAREAGPKQAAAYVAIFASPAGSACLTKIIKAEIGARPGPKADAAGLTGSVKAASVAEGGAVLAIRGSLKINGASVPLAFDLLAFHKAGVVILVSATALRGAAMPGQVVELAQKVAGRLS